MSLSSLAAAFFGAVGFILFIGAGWLAVDNYETLFYETPESVGPNEHYKAEREFNFALWMYVIGIPFFIGMYLARRPQRVKIEEHRKKNRPNKGEKTIVFEYRSKFIGLLGSNKSQPVEKNSNVYIDDDKIMVEIPKSKVKMEIPYSSVTHLQNVDARNKEDLDRVIGHNFVSEQVGRLLRKRNRAATIIKYTDEDLVPQIIALDFLKNTKYARPLIDEKMRQQAQAPKPVITTQIEKWYLLPMN